MGTRTSEGFHWLRVIKRPHKEAQGLLAVAIAALLEVAEPFILSNSKFDIGTIFFFKQSLIVVS